ncbi:MAG: hypothetical protein RL322_1139, partial [Pseudomonadota bacterium]
MSGSVPVTVPVKRLTIGRRVATEESFRCICPVELRWSL